MIYNPNKLHTNSVYAEYLLNSTFMPFSDEDYASYYLQLEQQELRFYRSFFDSQTASHINSYDDFIQTLKSIFNSSNAENDKSILKQFEAENFVNMMDKAVRNARNTVDAVKNTTDITFHKIDNKGFKINDKKKLIINPINKNTIAQIQCTIDTDKITMPIQWNPSVIKNIIDLYKEELEEINESGQKKKKNKKEAKTDFEKFQSLVKANVIEVNDSSGTQDELSFQILSQLGWKGFPFQWEGEQLVDPALEYLRVIADNEIKQFFTNVISNGSDKLKTAFWSVWDDVMESDRPCSYFHTTAKQHYSFKGNLGEFYSALVFNYIHLSCGLTKEMTTKILGDIPNAVTGEKPRSDVLLNSFGVQVKNWNMYAKNYFLGARKNVSLKIHPATLEKVWGNQKELVYDYIANYYFNSDTRAMLDNTASYNSLIEALETIKPQIMNLDIGANIADTNVLFMVGGRYMIPSSRIFKFVYDSQIKSTLSHSPKGSNQYYNELNNDMPRFTIYWQQPKHTYPSQSEPTEANNPAYLMGTATILTIFQFSQEFINENYSLW